MFIALISTVLSAPLGAECKLAPSKHMALRWSAQLLTLNGYKHRAPTEHFAFEFL